MNSDSAPPSPASDDADPIDVIPTGPPGHPDRAADDKHLDGETHISFREVQRVDVAVRNLAITVQPSSVSGLLPWRRKPRKGTDEEAAEGETRILNNVSADMPAGKLMAIIGGSGSGKTSMLNVLAHRMRGKNLRVSGTITFNENESLSSIRHAYVMQQDILLPRLTVRETLRYSAELRLPAGTTAAERERVVEEVILQLGLKECANTLIGDNEHKGCSGGEKRRVSIGVQLLANPSVLFLDEPTTGLDSTSAFQLVRTLKNLAMKGRTIVTTIHQPRSEIWRLFDRITLLSKGNPIYSGKASKALAYFESLGYALPEHVNPADFLVDLSQIDYRTPEAEAASIARVDGLIEAWRDLEPSVLSLIATKASSSKAQEGTTASEMKDLPTGAGQAPIWRQIGVLTRRTFKTTYRDPMGMAGCMVEAISMGVIAGWIFYDLPGTLSGIRSREAALYLAASLQGYLILLFETYRLSVIDIHVFDREHGEGVVNVAAFLLSRRFAKLLTEDIAVPLLYSVIYYFMCNFTRDPVKFFTFYAVVQVGQILAVTFAMLSVAVAREFSEAVLFGNLAYTVQSLACGYFIQANTMPVYVRWTKYIAYNWYAMGALTSNEFTDNFYDCPSPGGRSDPACKEYDGNFVLSSLSFPEHWITEPICINVAWFVGFYIMAGLLLKFFTVDISASSVKGKAEDDDKDRSSGKEKMESDSPLRNDASKINVQLEDYRLLIHKPGFFGRGRKDIEILKGVSARFEAGKLNVIMGPSGSGKSSLLNLMALRLHSTVATKYRASGRMLFNSVQPSESVIRSLCSYVTQDDTALLPSLTVRETLHFAARLRLPRHLSTAQKIQRAESVLLKLGLKDCADTLVGSDLVKGISGGEKRRVTIAVQILTEPRILLLDEPTSGLDAFTAGSILSVLKGLAEEGRTVIATVHQSRKDLFDMFGNILLLARGGHAVYSGPAPNMLSYFASLGHVCPTNTNAADFAIDLITVDLQHASRERTSRIKVQSLISRFSHVEALSLSPASPGSTSAAVDLPAQFGSMLRTPAPLRIALPILYQRAWLNMRRQPAIAIARIMQVLGLGIVLALFFAPLHHDYYSIQNRLGFIQEVLPLYFVGMLQNVALYPTERDTFYKEHDDGAYGVSAFFLSYTGLELPFEVVTCLLFTLLADLAVGLPRTASFFFVMALNALCIVSCGESIGIVFNTLVPHTGFSVNLTSTVLSIGVLMAGIMSIDMPGFLKGVNYISPMKYAVENLTPYSLRGVDFTCTDAQKVGGRCPIQTGEQALELYGLNGTKKGREWVKLVALVAVAVAYRAIAFAILKAKRTQWGVRAATEAVRERRRSRKIAAGSPPPPPPPGSAEKTENALADAAGALVKEIGLEEKQSGRAEVEEKLARGQ